MPVNLIRTWVAGHVPACRARDIRDRVRGERGRAADHAPRVVVASLCRRLPTDWYKGRNGPTLCEEWLDGPSDTAADVAGF